jgi:hypothetical protein
MANPYELRFDMYNTALDRLKESYYSKVEKNREEREEGKVILDEPVFPTPSDAIAEAEQIWTFVNGQHQ